MDFVTFWIISAILTFFYNRHWVKLALKEDKDFFDDDTQWLLYVAFIAPFIPIVNLIISVLLLIIIICVVLARFNSGDMARKLFFIKNPTEKI